MITQQLTGQVTEQLLPYLFYKTRVTKVSKGGIGITSVHMDNDIEYQTKQEPYWVSNIHLRLTRIILFVLRKIILLVTLVNSNQSPSHSSFLVIEYLVTKMPRKMTKYFTNVSNTNDKVRRLAQWHRGELMKLLSQIRDQTFAAAAPNWHSRFLQKMFSCINLKESKHGLFH